MALVSKQIFPFVFLLSLYSSVICELNPRIRYRIRSGLDGSMLTAQYPTYNSNLNLVLGQVTTEDWHGALSQLWTVRKQNSSAITNTTSTSSGSGAIYWMKPGRAVLNSLTGNPREKKIFFKITEITEESGTFIVTSVENDLCLENQGVGLTTVFKPCNELSSSQQWDFEDPRNLKVHIRLFNQLMSLFV